MTQDFNKRGNIIPFFVHVLVKNTFWVALRHDLKPPVTVLVTSRIGSTALGQDENWLEIDMVTGQTVLTSPLYACTCTIIMPSCESFGMRRFNMLSFHQIP